MSGTRLGRRAKLGQQLAQLGVGAGQQRSNVAGARPEQPADLGVVVAVQVTEEDRRPGDGLELGEPGVNGCTFNNVASR
jgi:hypothetical protein